MMPEIRETLFGENTRRVFLDWCLVFLIVDFLLEYRISLIYEFFWSVDSRKRVCIFVYCLGLGYTAFVGKLRIFIKNRVGVFSVLFHICLVFFLFFSLEMFQSSKTVSFFYVRMMVNRSVTPVLFRVCGSVLDLKINLEINVINEIKKNNSHVHY